MRRRSLKCFTCNSHKRRHRHSLKKTLSRKRHNSFDLSSEKSAARITEQYLLSAALPSTHYSKKTAQFDYILHEVHPPNVSYNSPHVSKNEDVQSLRRHSYRKRHQPSIPTYCRQCGRRYALAKSGHIQERQSQSREEIYVQSHLWDGPSTHDEKSAPAEYSHSARDPFERHHECKLGQRCIPEHDYSAHECYTTHFSRRPESRWAEDMVALHSNKFAKERKHSYRLRRERCSMFIGRRPQHLSEEEVTVRTANPLRMMSARSTSRTLTTLSVTEPPTMSTTRSLLEESWALQEIAKQRSNSQSEGYCRCTIPQASKLRTVRSGSYNSTSPQIYDKGAAMQTPFHSSKILHLETLKNSCARCTESAVAKIPRLSRSRPSFIRRRRCLIPTYCRHVRCRSFSGEYIISRSTAPTETTSETARMMETVDDSTLITMRSIRSADVHASSEHLNTAPTTTSSEDIVNKPRSTKQLPKLSHKRLLMPAQPLFSSSSTSSLASYQTPAKVVRITPRPTKQEENCSMSRAFAAASSVVHAARSKNHIDEERRVRPLENKQAMLTEKGKVCAKGRNMFPPLSAIPTKTTEAAQPPGNEGKLLRKLYLFFFDNYAVRLYYCRFLATKVCNYSSFQTIPSQI